MKKATRTTKSVNESKPEVARFIEIVNWKNVHPGMKSKGDHWIMLYTSLLDDDAFVGMEDSARVLITTLWLYAAHTGQYVFPADPKWLHRKIPSLNSEPDLGPLLEATDEFGNPAPFVAYCDPPKARVHRPRERGNMMASEFIFFDVAVLIDRSLPLLVAAKWTCLGGYGRSRGFSQPAGRPRRGLQNE